MKMNGPSFAIPAKSQLIMALSSFIPAGDGVGCADCILKAKRE